MGLGSVVMQRQCVTNSTAHRSTVFQACTQTLTCTHTHMYIHIHVRPCTALMTGDVVNGKARVLERANRNAGHGYSAIYYWNSNDKYQFASGLLRLEGLNFAADVQLPNTKW
jgi:hypothetical protein